MYTPPLLLFFYANPYTDSFKANSYTEMSNSNSNSVVLSIAEWDPTAIKYTAPKVNKSGGKSINLISKQRSRALHLSTPLMMTWGISDFVDEKTGESDGKYSMTLNFPNEEYETPATRLFLDKLKAFENQILDDAVRNSEVWWGEEMSREVAKHSFYPLLKYSKNKDTKRIDYSKPPSIRGKVPFYDQKWGVEIYNTKNELLFPCEDTRLSPIEFVPKLSNVACVLQCGGIWIGGKGWGITWKVVQCIVKPKEIVSIYGKCQIQLSPDDRATIDTQQINEDDNDDELSLADVPSSQIKVPVSAPPAPVAAAVSTLVEDSDDEAEPPAAPEPEPVVVAAPAAVKKVVKKAAPAEPEPVVAAPAAEESTPKVVKKVVKKVVTK